MTNTSFIVFISNKSVRKMSLKVVLAIFIALVFIQAASSQLNREERGYPKEVDLETVKKQII